MKMHAHFTENAVSFGQAPILLSAQPAHDISNKCVYNEEHH